MKQLILGKYFLKRKENKETYLGRLLVRDEQLIMAQLYNSKRTDDCRVAPVND